MARRARSWLWVALLAQGLAGCSLIFPFGVTGGDGDGGGEGGAADAALVDVAVHEGSGPGGEGTQGGDGPPATDAISPSDSKACPSCSYPSWCLESPTKLVLYDVWGTSLSNLWVVGAGGTLLKYDKDACAWKPADLSQGLTPSEQAAVTSASLYSVWGSGTTVYVVGSKGTILRRSGAKWSLETLSPTTSDHFLGVGGDVGSSRVFAVGANGKVYHLEGGVWVAWGAGPSQSLTGVSEPAATSPGAGSHAIYVVGTYGELVYNDSSGSKSFTPLSGNGCNTSYHWQGVWASPTSPAAPNPELVAVASSGEILHYRPGTAGSTVCTVLSDLKGEVLLDVHGLQADDLWAVGQGGVVARWQKGVWTKGTQTKTTATLRAVHVIGGSPRRVVAVGYNGVIIQTTY